MYRQSQPIYAYFDARIDLDAAAVAVHLFHLNGLLDLACGRRIIFSLLQQLFSKRAFLYLCTFEKCVELAQSPAQSTGLEVDSRSEGLQYAPEENNYPEAYRTQDASSENQAGGYDAPKKTPPAHERRMFGLRTATFWLSIALALSILFAVLAAAIGGLLAAKRLHELNQACKVDPSTTNIPVPADQNSTTCASLPSSTSTATATPSSNCTVLTVPYTTLNSSFELYCGDNFAYNDLMSVFIYTFEDCMNACVSYNRNGADEGTHNGSSCAGVSYSYT